MLWTLDFNSNLIMRLPVHVQIQNTFVSSGLKPGRCLHTFSYKRDVHGAQGCCLFGQRPCRLGCRRHAAAEPLRPAPGVEGPAFLAAVAPGAGHDNGAEPAVEAVAQA